MEYVNFFKRQTVVQVHSLYKDGGSEFKPAQKVLKRMGVCLELSTASSCTSPFDAGV